MASEYDHTPFDKTQLTLPPQEKLGCICWVEIPATDLPRAQTFYSTLFGWEFAKPSAMGISDEDNYIIFHKKGTALHGGIAKVSSQDKIVRPVRDGDIAVRVTVAVEEVGKALEDIKQNGGEIVREKTEIGGGMGYSGHFRDTEGNIIGVWSQA
ncbi:hypothetical protein FGG08_003708 [Glutinoglossum americanum]|uniref:VOC domain-containing protein n=1 Tax=Glutinoglossum americanum TaxID=1670608 RepID=A0A9P8L377_9PEZI|nr:hypothetical protein FGG08_003708 [Glutinoglossum americanum]